MKLPGKLPDRAYSLKARLVRPGSCFALRRAIAPARNRFLIFTCGGRPNMTVVWVRVECSAFGGRPGSDRAGQNRTSSDKKHVRSGLAAAVRLVHRLSTRNLR